MGMMQRYLEEIEARGWADVGKTVCSRCLNDEALIAAVLAEAGTEACDYCRERPSGFCASAPVEVILKLIVDGFRTEYEDPVEQVLYSSADGGYQMPMDDTWDLLSEYEITENEELFTDLLNAIQQDHWVQFDPYAASPQDALRWGWQGFREFVKHRRRYTFLVNDDSEMLGAGDISMDAVPAALAEAIETAGQIRVLPAGTKWWRIRVHPAGESYHSACEIGSPPDEWAQDNRMTAKGIGAFYGSSTAEGARAEVAGYAAPEHSGTIGLFTLLRDISVVDLTTTEKVPSLFDEQDRLRRPAISFMRDFVESVRTVADPSDRQNLNYIPTQVIAEFFRYQLSGEAGPVQAILWRSSKDPSVETCVIFASNEQMTDQGLAHQGWMLALDPDSVQQLPTISG